MIERKDYFSSGKSEWERLSESESRSCRDVGREKKYQE